MKYIPLVILWILWCTLHSALISPSVTEFFLNRFSGLFRYYRLLYNLTAVVTLLPVLAYGHMLRDAPIFGWNGLWRIVQILLVIAALCFFIAGARRYDFLQFIGIRQIRDEKRCSTITEDCSLNTEGVLALVRHPWYTGGMLIVWARPLDTVAVLTNIIICGYFVVGAVLEERKLKRQFGRQYSDYQRRVSMFFPIKWARRLLLQKS
jgi:protein-S-isoprenylcysteine O-methyltransferase Ste14